MIEKKRYLVTSALPYANGPLHIGHLGGAYLSADIFVRFLRLTGKDVVYICGSDEHGAAITIRAKKDGTTPQAIVDKYHALIKSTFEKIGMSFDIYHRTSAPIHHETSQDFFRTLYKNGEFLEKTSKQYYDKEAEQFLADRYITGTCPKCGHADAYGDQCEKCGSTLSPTELINPTSTLSGGTPELRETTHWYLQLDKYEEWLREWIENGKLNGQQLHEPSDWKNHVLGQCKSWLDGGLQPRSMTRDLDWGIDVPAEIPNAAGKKLYVWLDAPIGYISATKEWAANNGKDWKQYWQDEESALVHFIGKDNIVFHCLIFPAILKSHGDYVLPINVPANQFLNLEGKKLSTSKNWAVWVHEYVEEFEGRIDELRYNLIKNMPEQRDSEFTWKGFQETTNNELVNNFANFVNRVVVLTNKYYEGEVPEFNPDQIIIDSNSQADTSFHDAELLALHDQLQDLGEQIRSYEFRAALTTLLGISARGNQLLQFNEPWKAIKTQPETVKVVLNVGLQIVAALSVACRPFLPFTSDKLRGLLNLPPLEDKGELTDILSKLSEGSPILEAGHTIGDPIHLFTKIEDSIIEGQIEKLNAASVANAANDISYEPVKETITYDDFSKLDIRTGVILEAEKVKKTKKLLKLKIDIGAEERTVVSGIAEYYQPENIVGQEVLLLANLAPRTLRGIESQGMILMAENEKGELAFVQPKVAFGGGFTVK